MLPLSETSALFAAAMAAGAINAVAGGGTLVTFPTLLLFGTPSVVANATSTLALTVGTAGSVYGYRNQWRAVKPWLWRFVPVSIVGGLIGSVLLTHTSEKTFSKLVPFLILFATIVFLLQGIFRRLAGMDSKDAAPPHHLSLTGAVLFQFAVAVYGGYFGAGIGILMLASLGFIGLRDIFEMNALKTVLGSLINLVASVWFVFAGLIEWHKAAVMVVGAVIGYFLGAHYSQRIPPRMVRRIITAIGLVLSGVTFYQQFIR